MGLVEVKEWVFTFAERPSSLANVSLPFTEWLQKKMGGSGIAREDVVYSC